MSLHQPFAPEGFQLAVLHREVLCPWLHQDKFPLWCLSHRFPVPTQRTLCVGGCVGEEEGMAEGCSYLQCYTGFTSVYPSGVLWILQQKRWKGNEDPCPFASLSGCQFGIYLGQGSPKQPVLTWKRAEIFTSLQRGCHTLRSTASMQQVQARHLNVPAKWNSI